MKTITFLFFATLLVSCAKSNEEKAKVTVKNYLDSTLNDRKSYEAVSWGSLRRGYPIHSNMGEFKALMNRSDSFRKETNKYDILSNKHQELWDSILSINQQLIHLSEQEIREDTTQPQNGWIISHKYRAANKMGGTILFEEDFKLTMNCDSVKSKKNAKNLHN